MPLSGASRSLIKTFLFRHPTLNPPQVRWLFLCFFSCVPTLTPPQSVDRVAIPRTLLPTSFFFFLISAFPSLFSPYTNIFSQLLPLPPPLLPNPHLLLPHIRGLFAPLLDDFLFFFSPILPPLVFFFFPCSLYSVTDRRRQIFFSPCQQFPLLSRKVHVPLKPLIGSWAVVGAAFPPPSLIGRPPQFTPFFRRDCPIRVFVEVEEFPPPDQVWILFRSSSRTWLALLPHSFLEAPPLTPRSFCKAPRRNGFYPEQFFFPHRPAKSPLLSSRPPLAGKSRSHSLLPLLGFFSPSFFSYSPVLSTPSPPWPDAWFLYCPFSFKPSFPAIPPPSMPPFGFSASSPQG